MNFDISTEQLHDDTYVISLAGEVDLYTAPEFKQQLLQVIAKGAGAGASTEMRRHLNEIERSLSQPVAKAVPALRDVFRGYRS